MKLFLYSNELIKINYPQMKRFPAYSLADVVFRVLINLKMPIIDGILAFMSRINFIHS